MDRCPVVHEVTAGADTDGLVLTACVTVTVGVPVARALVLLDPQALSARPALRAPPASTVSRIVFGVLRMDGAFPV
jgi:hypothetical protein